MHPPDFRPSHLLLDWPDCTLELRSDCGRVTMAATQLLASRFGNVPFAELLPRLVCSSCGKRFAPVYLVAGRHREHCHGGPPSWSLELVAAPAARDRAGEDEGDAAPVLSLAAHKDRLARG